MEKFLETKSLSTDDIGAHRLSTVQGTTDVRIADFTARSAAREFGVTSAIFATKEYGLPQSWATNLQLAGFEGAKYLLSHDLQQELVGIALFGLAGELHDGPWTYGSTIEIDAALVTLAESTFEFRVLAV